MSGAMLNLSVSNNGDGFHVLGFEESYRISSDWIQEVEFSGR